MKNNYSNQNKKNSQQCVRNSQFYIRTAEGSNEANPQSAPLKAAAKLIRNPQSFTLTFSFILLFFTNISFSQSNPVAFTQEDRDRIIRTDTRLDEGFKQIDKRFEQVDKRFEQVNQRFEQTNTFMGWMIALFGGMFATTIIFALWDRRTMIRPFESKVKEIEVQIDLLKTDSTNKSILSSLRELAKTDSKLAEILKMHNLL
jgi:hypothetical protein